MAIPRKSPPNQVAVLNQNYPTDLPDLPKKALDIIPDLKPWKELLDKVWYDLITALQRDRNDLANPINASSNEITTIQNNLDSAVAALRLAIQQLASQSSVDLGPVNDAIDAVESDLSDHIASHIVHGTESQVVGEDDEEFLESKTVGLNQPRYGRFRQLIGGNVVSAAENVEIPVNFNMVVAGDFLVDGTITVDGTLLVM
jgi:hypothetical protein